jgi:hypothetical protein
MNNLQLIETINFLQNNYNILNSTNFDKLDDIEKVFLNENKQELTNRIKLLLIKNPDWEEFLNPVLEELSYNTISMDYINDKINTIKELEEEINDKDYKQEVNNLCSYLKNELETNKNLLETELFMNEEKERIIKSYDELLKDKVLSEVVSQKCLDYIFDDNKSLFFCVCRKGDKTAAAFMLNSYPNELKNKRVLHQARGLVEKSQTTLNKKAMLGFLRKEILLITYPTK